VNRSRVEDLVQQARCELGSGNRTNALGLLKRALSIDPDGDAITQTILAIEKDLVGRPRSTDGASSGEPASKSSPAPAATDRKTDKPSPRPSTEAAKPAVKPAPAPTPGAEEQAGKPVRKVETAAGRLEAKPARELSEKPQQKPASAMERPAAKPSPSHAAVSEKPEVKPLQKAEATAERPAVSPATKPSAETERPAVRPATKSSAETDKPAAKPVPKPVAEREKQAARPPQKAAEAAERPSAKPSSTPAARETAARGKVPGESPPERRRALAAVKESAGGSEPQKRRESVAKGGDDGAKKRLIEEIFALSESALKAGDDTGALECLKRAEVLSPENPEVQERMAYLRKSLKAKIMIKTGYSRLAEENFVEAVTSARKAFDLSPDVDGLEAFITEIEACSRDSEEEESPSSAEYDDAEVWVSRIRSRIQEGAFPLAAELAARASAIYPDHELIRTFVERFTKMKLLPG
jgi:tetratricopeptide (TPR) repeat protein